MRSTVPPGTAEDRVIPLLEETSSRKLGDRLSYYSNPEFLREGSSVRDFRSPPFTLIGAPPGDDATILREIYAGIRAPVHVAPFRVAESVKHISNVFHAVKLTFANEAGAILAAYGVDAREALRLLCEDRMLNISPAYLRPGFAFGGSCLPKDVRSFISLADQKNLAAPMLKNLMPANNAIIDRTFAAVACHGRHRSHCSAWRSSRALTTCVNPRSSCWRRSLSAKATNCASTTASCSVATLMGSNRAYIDREIPHLERLMVVSPADGSVGARG